MFNTKKIARLIIMILLFLIFTVSALHAFSSFKCPNYFTTIGDYNFKVLNSCGEPISKEITGYVLKNGKRELKIEVWIYGPKNGWYYQLTFEGGKLVAVEGIRD